MEYKYNRFNGRLVTEKEYRKLRIDKAYLPKGESPVIVGQLTEEEYFELGRVPRGVGAVLHGWHSGPQSVLDFRAMTERCPHDCAHCFTNKTKRTLTPREINNVINQAKDLGYVGINYLGEGEPTIDSDFFRIINHTSSRGLVPIVFTEAATRLRKNWDYAERLNDANASICPKCDSLFSEDYQNSVVGDLTGAYFQKRNEVVWGLERLGFSWNRKDGQTRLGFDMVVTKRNVDEVEQTLRHCRDRNIWVVFSTYLPAGRCSQKNFNDSLALSQEELVKMRRTIKRVDAEYGFNHPIFNNFGTFPCVEFMQIYGNGDVSPCPGNETIVGNVRKDSLDVLAKRIRERFPCHRLENQDGNCAYRLGLKQL